MRFQSASPHRQLACLKNVTNIFKNNFQHFDCEDKAPVDGAAIGSDK